MTQGRKAPIKHAMTVDVEDYFHVAAFKDVIDPKDWDTWPCRVEKNTDNLLALFDQANIKITFFVLAWVAERYPALVKRIQAQGHEIASHGYSHQLIYSQTPECFKEETHKSKARKNNIAYITRNREFLDNFKLNASCKLCGYNKCAEALDFHHISEHNKEANVSRLANESNSLERIQEQNYTQVQSSVPGLGSRICISTLVDAVTNFYLSDLRTA